VFIYLQVFEKNNLNSTMDHLRQEDSFIGLIIVGQCSDIGLPEHYLETLNRFL